MLLYRIRFRSETVETRKLSRISYIELRCLPFILIGILNFLFSIWACQAPEWSVFHHHQNIKPKICYSLCDVAVD